MSSEIPLTDTIEREIQEQGISSFLNNFILRVPWHGYGTIYDDPSMLSGPDRKTIEVMGELDIPYNKQNFSAEERMKYSDTFLSGTPRDFFRNIDDLIAEQGLVDIIDIATQERQVLERNCMAAQRKGDWEKYDIVCSEAMKHHDRFNLALKPVYIEMRKRGFSHADLTL